MSVLNDDNIKEKTASSEYELPAVIRKEKEEDKFEKALFISLILHPAVIIVILLTSLILKFLGIDFSLLKKPDLKPKDIEFVLVEKEAPPIDKNTKNRADKNSRAGGKHDPKRPVSLPQASAPKSADKKPAAPKTSQPKKAEQPKQKQQQSVKPQVQKPVVQPQQPKVQPKVQPQVQQQSPAPAPKAPVPRPTPAPAAPKAPSKPLSNFNIPIPKSNIPQVAQPTAPVTPAPTAGGGSTSGVKSGTGTGTPAPTFSQSTGGKSSGSSAGGTGGGNGRFSNSNGTGSGNVGNPGPGNPKGAPGIDAIKEPDFGPYMKELQRRIKMNWDPPKGNESKRVILLFTISKDGRLLNVKVQRSSGLPAADNAAINAVKLTAPFRPLPPEFRGNSVDIQFTFDYNVLGVSMY